MIVLCFCFTAPLNHIYEPVTSPVSDADRDHAGCSPDYDTPRTAWSRRVSADDAEEGTIVRYLHAIFKNAVFYITAIREAL